MNEFENELTSLINKYSMENGSDTPDFILAKYLVACLRAFSTTVRNRDNWYGVSLYPGCGIAERLKKQGEGIEEMESVSKNRDYWREKYKVLSGMLCKSTPSNQEEWEGAEKELEKLIAERLEKQG